MWWGMALFHHLASHRYSIFYWILYSDFGKNTTFTHEEKKHSSNYEVIIQQMICSMYSFAFSV